MPNPMPTPNDLRQIAEDLIALLEDAIHDAGQETAGLAVSLVRQWATYDGNAALCLGDDIFFFPLRYSPLGSPSADIQPSRTRWPEMLVRDWKVQASNLPDLIERFNLGQSAEFTSGEGETVRWWIDPRKRTIAIDNQTPPTGTLKGSEYYLVIAVKAVRQAIGDSLHPEELDMLAKSVVNQWATFANHAAILTEQGVHRLLVDPVDSPSGGCSLTTRFNRFDTFAALRGSGVPSDQTRQVMARLNLALSFTLPGLDGRPARLGFNPLTGELILVPVGVSLPRGPHPQLIFCPACGARLAPPSPGNPEQSCTACRRTMEN